MINHFTEKKLSNWGSMPSLHRWSKCRQPILVSVSNVMTPMINLYEKGYCGGWLRYFLLISVNFEMSFCVFNSFKKISALVGYGKNSSFQVRFLEELKTPKFPFEIIWHLRIEIPSLYSKKVFFQTSKQDDSSHYIINFNNLKNLQTP